MDTIIFLYYKHEIYVGDYYKEKIKEVKFEKADSWEVYHYEDFEKLLEYMQYPLKYNNFKNNRLIFLFDDIRFYEWLMKAKRYVAQSEQIYAERIEPMLEVVQKEQGRIIKEGNEHEEEADKLPAAVADIYKYVLDMDWSKYETTLRYELVLSPATLYKRKEEGKKQYLHVEDIVDLNSLIADETWVKKGDEVLEYDHYVKKLFGGTKIEHLSKRVNSEGCFYWHLPQKDDGIFVNKDEVIGIIDYKKGTREEMLGWCKKIL